MNKIILVGLCISLILLSGCTSYEMCKADCLQSHCPNAKRVGRLPALVDDINSNCTEEYKIICYQECK